MNKLRKKFVIAVFASATVVFALTVFFTFLTIRINNSRRFDEMTAMVVENGGTLPRRTEMFGGNRLFGFGFNEESTYRMRFFTVFFENGAISRADVSNIASVDAEKAMELAERARLLTRAVGFFGEYRYRRTESMLVFLDCSDELDSMRTLILTVSLISLIFVTLITIVFYLLSKKIVRPFEENARQQKRFITDASHELKTPLAIISANAEVLSYKYGENEWINNITAQVERTSALINELLTLNRLEEIESNTDLAPVDMGETAEIVADEFAELFAAKNAAVERSIERGSVVNGQPEQLKRLVSVLVDNAAKYVKEGGVFRISVEKLQRSVRLNIFNTCELDRDVDYSALFNRFYRSDASRNSGTGGHGVGLSIAKRITDLHGGSIEALPEGDGLKLSVTLPRKK